MVDVARIVQTPGVIVVLYQGTTNSVHRPIFTDGRALPKDPNPTWMGYSVGRWDGDTLVVDTAGFNDRSWLDIEEGHPHTEALRITERFRRRDFGHMDLEMTVDDPKTFTRPFSFRMDQTLTPDTDLLESVCEHDTSVPHMLGGTETIKLAPQILAKYTGTYEYTTGRAAVITFEGDLLFLQEGTNPLKLPLTPNSRDRLCGARDPAGARRSNSSAIRKDRSRDSSTTQASAAIAKAVRKGSLQIGSNNRKQ